MKRLILDASQKKSILALLDNYKVIKTQFVEGRSNMLLPALKDFCDLKNLLYIAVGIGPGSFMGIRAVATIAKTLSFALSIPLITFPSPLAFLPEKTTGTFTLIGDAKMGKIFIVTGETDPFSISSPRFIFEKDLKIDTEHTIDLRKNPPPELFWTGQYIESQYKLGKIAAENDLILSYSPIFNNS